MFVLFKRYRSTMKTNKKVYQPTEAVKNNILRGIALKSKYNRTSLLAKDTANEVPKMKTLLEKGFDLDAVKELYNTLSNHKVDFRRRVAEGEPSEEIIKHYLNGGDAGLAWAKLVLKSEKIINSDKRMTNASEIHKQADDKVFGAMQVEPTIKPELRQVTFVAMVPDEIDFHGDVTTADEVRKAKESWNESKQQANLFHLEMTDTFRVIESYLAPADMVLDDKFVMKGTWLMTLQVEDDQLWDLVKSGDACGISIGAMAQVENLE